MVRPMPTPTDVPRKIRQLENDVTSIYEMLDTIDGRVSDLDTRLNVRLTKLDTKVTMLDTKVSKLDTGVNARLDEIVELLKQR
jgi:hypothetical protein